MCVCACVQLLEAHTYSLPMRTGAIHLLGIYMAQGSVIVHPVRMCVFVCVPCRCLVS